MSSLAASLDAPPSGRAAPVWFDSLAYCREKLLNGSPVPWALPGELSAFFVKAQGMFRSDAVLVDLADLHAQRVENDDALTAAMAARRRPGFALRTLLADERARATAHDAITAIGAGVTALPVVLSVPSPSRWLVIAARQAGGAPQEPPELQHVDAAAMYVADRLRAFATDPVDGLLLDDGPTAPDALVDMEGSRPVFNVAGHYNWPVWVRTDNAPCWPHGGIAGVAGWLGASAPRQDAGPWGLVHTVDTEEPHVPAVTGGGPVLATVPAAADPDAMMSWVRQLG